MRTIFLETTANNKILEQFHRTMGGELSSDGREHSLKIDNEWGQGHIKEMSFKGGISHLMVDMEFSQELGIALEGSKEPSICFAYCSNGQMVLGQGKYGERTKLENFQTGILAGKQQKELQFGADIAIKMILILVNPLENREEEDHLNRRLQKMFFGEDPEASFSYAGSYNLRIAERVQQLGSINETGIARSFMVKGLIHMILALEIQQHADDLRCDNASMASSLTTKEMDTIRELSLFINNYLDRTLSISYLCKKGGLSPSKLQEGFKLLHNATVTNYIRDVRIRKAEELIKNTDLNISEVVYSIGLISRSYFSKIFKAKYKCSPKLYREKQQVFSIAT